MEQTVAQLQELLTRLGYLGAPYDPNVLDEPTRAALKRFQELHALAATGEPDEATVERLREADGRGECLVTGRLEDERGAPVGGAVLIVDRELGPPASWPRLGAARVEPNGRFVIRYALARVAPGDRQAAPNTWVPDLIFQLREVEPVQQGADEAQRVDIYRLPEDRLLTGDERELGLEARRFEQVRIVVQTGPARWTDGASEYERLVRAFREVWPNQPPESLDDARREPEFVARELDVPLVQIDALVGAARLSRQVFDGSVPEPILYGLARSDRQLGDLPRLAAATGSDLKRGIYQAVERLLIPPQDDGTISESIERIRGMAPEHLLRDAPAGEPGLGAVLEAALPDVAAQTVLVREAPGREDDPPAFWAELRARPEFAAPGTVERAQLALQLDVLTGRHVALSNVLQREEGLASTRDLLDVDVDRLKAIVGRPDVGVPPETPGATPEAQIDIYVAGLTGAVHLAFPTESVARLVSAAPADAVGGAPTQGALRTLLDRATSEPMRAAGAALDLRTTPIDVYLAAHGETVMADVAADDRAPVVAQLKRAQRLFRVSTDPGTFAKLLVSPFGSAHDIANIPRQTFALEVGGLLGADQAMMVHTRAVETTNATLFSYVQVQDAVNGIWPAALMGGDRVTVAGEIERTVLKHLPTWSELFGPTSLCACPDCRSVFSPAAYLVDLLGFLDTSGKNTLGLRPLDVLLRRRPDLAQLKLSCENTNTLIPYVDLVNEVLESLVVEPDLTRIPAFDTEGVPSPELQANPQHTNWSAYNTPPGPDVRPRLDRAVAPQALPFDAALLVTRTYLEHLGVSRAALMAAYSTGPLSNALAAERMGLSPAAWALIAGVGLDEAPTDLETSPDARFGLTLDQPPALAEGNSGRWVWALKRKLITAGAALALGSDPAAEPFDPATTAAVQTFQTENGLTPDGAVDAATWTALLPVGPSLASAFLPQAPALLARTGLGVDDLLAVLQMRFVNPAGRTLDVVTRLRLPGVDLLAFVDAGFVDPSPALLDALATEGVEETAFTTWAQTQLSGEAWERFRLTILADGPVDQSCALDSITVRHWDDALPWLTDDEWVRLDQLVRLWRGLGGSPAWTLADLDLALCALDATSFTPSVLRQLAQVQALAGQLDLSVPLATVLWRDLDPSLPGSLYAQRFLNRTLPHVSFAFAPDWQGTVLAGARLDEQLPALQAGLRASSADLAALRAHLGWTAPDEPLDLARVSLLLRHVTLARALQINVRDLLLLLRLTGIAPFVAPTDDWPLLRLVEEARRLNASGLNAAQLDDVLADLSTVPADAGRERTIGALRDGLRALAVETMPAPDPDGALTRRALGRLEIDPAVVDAAVAILLGTDTTTVVLAAPPAPEPAIPAEWTDRLRYDRTAFALTGRGALTEGERLEVQGFSADAGYVDAVDRLFAAPRAGLASLGQALAEQGIVLADTDALLAQSVFGGDAAEREGATAARFATLLEQVLPPLRDRLSRTLVKASLTTAIGLPAGTVALLLEGQRAAGQPILPATDPAQRAMADFLALAADASSDDTLPPGRAYELLARIGLLVTTLGLAAEDVAVLAGRLVALRGDPDLHPHRLVSYADWQTIAAYGRLRSALPRPDGGLARLWQAPAPEAVPALLGELLDWPESTIADLLGPAGLALGTDDLQRVDVLERFVAAGTLTRQLGVGAVQAAKWARQAPAQADADAARSAAKARYDQPAWLEVARTLNDTLRDRQRTALVAYLLPRLRVVDANGLYQLLLLDVEMSPCMQTSRIKQAISSVQLFVQRALMGLEQHDDLPELSVAPAAIDAGHWAWMQNYRVWEANRRVLIYPENWIEPELRDDKTPLFQELESELLRDDVTDPIAEGALLSYLEKLDTIAKLDVVALCVQDDFTAGERLREVVHVFGRTANPPAAYFYRRRETSHNGTVGWTPWQKVPVDMQGHLIAPIVWNRRLYVFWATVTDKAKAPPSGTKVPADPEPYQEIGLAWSELRNGAWSPKHVTEATDVLIADDPATMKSVAGCQGLPPGKPAGIDRLEARIESGRLRVVGIFHMGMAHVDNVKNVCYPPSVKLDGDQTDYGNNAYEMILGSFRLDDCHGRLRVDTQPDRADYTRGFVLRLKDGDLQAKPLTEKPMNPLVLLSRTAENTTFAEDHWAHLDGGYLVYSDAQRAYFVTLAQTWSRAGSVIAHADSVLPDVYKAAVKAASKAEMVTAAAAGAAAKAYMKSATMAAERTFDVWTSAAAQQSFTTLSTRLDAQLDMQVSAQLDMQVNAEVSTEVSNRAGALTLVDKGSILADVGASHALLPDLYQTFAGPRSPSLTFEPFFHPFVCTYVEKLQQGGIPALLTLANQQLGLAPSFAARYGPDSRYVERPYPVDGVDFGATAKPNVYQATAYAIYNWELFFHAPMLIGDRLSKNQRFEDALRWYHYVFNPTSGDKVYWKVLPFMTTPVQKIDQFLQQLSAGDPDLQRQIAEWRDHPFQPHLIARMRLGAYQKNVVMRYLDNLIAWGDQLFGRDTLETINQATLLYVMAADLLGPRPARLPPRGEPVPLTFAEMRGKLDALGNVVAEFENHAPFLNSATAAPAQATTGLLGIGRTQYFGLPPNEKLLGYWDTVADRLFKIRNCMNIEGVVRQLPLFEPPIDPALLVRAAAGGVDLSSVLGDVSAPLPLYRFGHGLARALEACNDLNALGAALLSALEKGDAEVLAALRAGQESALLRRSLETRKQQEEEAKAQAAALRLSRDVPLERLRHFRGLMGLVDLPAPETIHAPSSSPQPRADGGVFLIDEEGLELAASHSARDWQVRSATMEVLASLSHYIPSISTEAAPWGVGVAVEFGGKHVGPALGAIARYQASLGQQDAYDASHAGKMAVYKRRQQEWALQMNVAARELTLIDQQVVGATIRADVARLEREQLERQIAAAETVETYLRDKYTNAELYSWMQGQIAAVYFQSYQLAYDLAKKAERSYRYERGVTSSSYIQFGAWDSLRKGLLAGDRLHLQLRQLERAYHDQNRRELELTKHVSLLQHAPLALIRLKETGRCEVDLPEVLFDLDYPGHYMRRIKSVSMSVPAVTGPYTSVNATLTLLGNETRIAATLSNGRYERDLESADGRFVDDFAAVAQIATSGAQNDNGLFELNFRDERYLPFEGAGAASRWRIVIDPDCNRFDLGTIADVVLHVHYTARDGGQQLQQKAKERWKKVVADQEGLPLARLFSLKHEFPTEWYRFQTVAAADGAHAQGFALTRGRFPLLFQRSQITVGAVELFGVPGAGQKPTRLPALTTPRPDLAAVDLLPGLAVGGLLHHSGAVQVAVKDAAAEATWQLSVAPADLPASLRQLDDVFVLCHYSARPLP